MRANSALRKQFIAAHGPAVAGRLGPMAVWHHAGKPEYVCHQGLHLTWIPVKSMLDPATAVGEAPLRQYIRCRKCDGCRRHKRAMWTARAIVEAERTAERGRRTWLLTATHRMRPDQGGDDLFSREITLAFKRLRKLAAFRYLLVFERHKPKAGQVVGYPHCHALVHEVDPMLYADFRICFTRIGFFEAKLLKGEPSRAAGYVAKYMTKADALAVCRVRASIAYGEIDADDGQGSDIVNSMIVDPEETSVGEHQPVQSTDLDATPSHMTLVEGLL